MVEMTKDFSSPVTARYLAAGCFFSGENDYPWVRQALFLLTSLPQAFFLVKMASWDLSSPVAARSLAAGFCVAAQYSTSLAAAAAARKLAAGVFFL